MITFGVHSGHFSSLWRKGWKLRQQCRSISSSNF